MSFSLQHRFLFLLTFTLVCFSPSGGRALPVDSVVTVQPIQVCNDFGSACAPIGFFEAETDKIWAQAGIDIDFLAPTQFHSTNSLFLDNVNDTDTLFFHAGNGQHPDSRVLNMWFVNDIMGLLGYAEIENNRSIISELIFSTFAFAALDVIAHEIGHNLGLNDQVGFHDPLNLMGIFTDIDVLSIHDIFPDGVMAEQLRADQITTARSSRFVIPIMTQPIPEPSILWLLGSGLAGLGIWRWRIYKSLKTSLLHSMHKMKLTSFAN